MTTDKPLPDETRAQVWADEFCKHYSSILCRTPGEEGVVQGSDFKTLMLGWFANALEAGRIEGYHAGKMKERDRQEQDRETSRIERLSQGYAGGMR